MGGNSSSSGKIFTLQKKIIRIMAGAQPRTLYRSQIKQLDILPVPCQYILPLMNVIINNQENFETNLLIHNINTKNKHHLLDQILTYLVFKQGHCVLESKFPTV